MFISKRFNKSISSIKGFLKYYVIKLRFRSFLALEIPSNNKYKFTSPFRRHILSRVVSRREISYRNT